MTTMQTLRMFIREVILETIDDVKNAQRTQWVKPSIEEERHELERTAEAFGIEASELIEAAKQSKLEALDVQTWSQLENTDSYETDTIEKATELAHGYNRDIKSIEAALGSKLPAPIVLFKDDEPPYLVAGNTRLMVARAYGITPQVLAVRI
jgi:hypothetical protein